MFVNKPAKREPASWQQKRMPHFVTTRQFVLNRLFGCCCNTPICLLHTLSLIGHKSAKVIKVQRCFHLGGKIGHQMTP